MLVGTDGHVSFVYVCKLVYLGEANLSHLMTT